MSTLENKSLAFRFYDEVLNGKKLHLLDEVLAENFEDHNPEPDQPKGREGVRAMFRNFLAAFPDMSVRVESMVAEGDNVGVFVTMTGTHLGAFAGLPATGRRVTVTGFDWIRISNGKAVERWGVFDNVGMMKQLGAVPGPSPSDLKGMSRRYYELLDKGKGDLATIRAEIFHPQHLSHFGGQPRPFDAVGFQQLAQGFWAAFPDLDHSVTSQIAEGDMVFNRMTAKATHKGEFFGVKATNKSIQVDAIAAHRFADGRLIEQWIEVDMVGLLQQIGAMPKS